MSLPSRTLTILSVAAFMLLGEASLHAQTPNVEASVESTRSQLTALRDAFVKQAAKSGVSCAIQPPSIVVQDVFSFGSYDPDTNALTSPAWEQMTMEERALFYKGLPPGASEADARADFEIGVHHWVMSMSSDIGGRPAEGWLITATTTPLGWKRTGLQPLTGMSTTHRSSHTKPPFSEPS